MSTKLHELLAVESDREAASKAILNETQTTFTKKPEHFIGRHAIYKGFEEGAQDDEEVSKEMVTTVADKLKHCFSVVVKSLDVTATKDAANQLAKAAIVIGDKTITPELPATSLLMIESKLKGWLDVLYAIPTLAPGCHWQKDDSKGANVYLDTNPERKFRTKKARMHKVLVEPTAHHPAQVESWTEDQRIGAITETVWSGMMSPADKSKIIERCQELLSAAKQARQRANMQEVKQVSVGKSLVDYLLG